MLNRTENPGNHDWVQYNGHYFAGRIVYYHRQRRGVEELSKKRELRHDGGSERVGGSNIIHPDYCFDSEAL